MREYPSLLTLAALLLAFGGTTPASAEAGKAAATQPCRIDGVATELQCGVVQRPLDPAKPEGRQIEVHYLVVPAMARNKQPDPVLMLAGGPGQSAINVASQVLPRLSRLSNRRDLVFIDQRGTGRSAPLECPDESRLPTAEALDPQAQLQRLRDCQAALEKLPYGDLRQFTTTIAMQDFDAVRAALGAERWNLVGGSYGTRAALEYQRQFPEHVRRTVLDGVAPPDMVLPDSFSTDGQAALDAMFSACEQEAACDQRFPLLRQRWSALLQGLPRRVTVAHPISGEPESFTLRRDMLLRAVRGPMYVPALAAGLPAAIDAAARGRFDALMGLAGTMGSSKGVRLAMGMHFSVICAEDMPRLGSSADRPGADFGRSDAELYSAVCKTWPRGAVPEAFYTMPKAQTPVLLLSGGADPVTPPRHGEHAGKALGDKARHIVIAQAGHGVMGLGCMRDVVYRFIDAKDDAGAATGWDPGCAAKLPRPPAYLPIETTP